MKTNNNAARMACVEFTRRLFAWLARTPTLSLFALLVALAFCAPAAQADDLDYVYDESGRLVQATNRTSGEAVRYTYDAVGNITSQVSGPLATLAIGHFSPRRGPVGAQVTINGTGFSDTSSANIVRFNGTQATVISSSQTRIVVAVPAAASGGPISVQVGAATATSTESFTVTATSDEPAITMVLPNRGFAGNVVTIVGANFDVTPSRNRVRFNNSLAEVIESTATNIVTRVPLAAGSGKIKVTTPRGLAVSPADFVVLPPGYPAERVEPAQRLSLDTGANVELVAGRIATRLFEGTVGDLLAIGVSNMPAPNSGVAVYGPDNTLVALGYLNEAVTGLQLPALKLSGTYTIFIDPGATATATLTVFKPSSTAIVIDGAPTTVTMEPAGRRALLTFSAAANTFPNLLISDATLSATYSLFSPDGVLMKSGPLDAFTGLALKPALQRAGTYKLLIDPAGSVGGSVTVSLTSTTSPLLLPFGEALEMQVSVNAPPVTLPFRAIAGRYMSLAAEMFAAAGPFGFQVTVFGPDGSALTGRGFGTAFNVDVGWRGAGVLNFGPLQEGGTYKAVIEGLSNGGEVHLTLSEAAQGGIPPRNDPHVVPVERAGQSVLRPFFGEAGRFVSIAVEEELGFMHGATATIIKPDGTELLTKTFTITPGDGGVGGGFENFRHGSAVVNMGPLPMTGRYQVLLQQIDPARPEDDIEGEWRLIFSEPFEGAISIDDDEAAEVSLNIPGKGVLYRFAGVAGQRYAIGLSSDDASGTVDAMGVTVLDRYGREIAGGGMIILNTASGGTSLPAKFGSGVVNVPPLPESGTYTIFVQQLGYETDGRVEISTTLTRPMTPSLDAPGELVATTDREGQGLLASFTATAGEFRNFRVNTEWRITDATMMVVASDGAIIASTNLIMTDLDDHDGGGVVLERGHVGHGFLGVGPLTAGTYQVLVEQRGSGRRNTGTFRLKMTSSVTGSLTPNGTSHVTIPFGGQGLRYAFNANAGSYRAVVVSEANSLIPSAEVSIVAPNGAVVASGPFQPSVTSTDDDQSYYSGEMLLNAGPMPSTGTYQLVVQPKTYQGLDTAALLSVTLSEPLQGAASAQPVSVDVRGRGLLRTFSGTAGQHVTVQVAETESTISSADIAVIAPQGAVLNRTQLYPAFDAGTFSGSATTSSLLPATGTYSVLVQQTSLAAGGIGALTVSASTVPAGTGSNANITTTVPGQSITRTFTAAAGQSFTAALSSVTLAPEPAAGYYMQVIRPDGALAETAFCSGDTLGCQLPLRNLPLTGTYQLLIQPTSEVTVNGVLTISPALTGTLIADTAFAANLNAPGRAAHLTFTTTARQNWSLILGSLNTTPAGAVLAVTVFNSAGAIVGNWSTTTSAALNMFDLPADSYFVWIVPQSPATTTTQITLRTNASGAVPVNGAPAAFTTPSAAQQRYFTFQGQADQSVIVALSDITTQPAAPDGSFGLRLAAPDGSLLHQVSCAAAAGSCSLPWRNLPATGTYTVAVEPWGLFAVSGKIKVAAALSATLAVDTPTPLNLGFGQPAHLTFTATVGQHLSVDIDSVTTVPANIRVDTYVYNSAGGQTHAGPVLTGLNRTHNLPNLAPGTYFLWLVPEYPATTALQVTLKSVGTVPVDGTPVPVATVGAGNQQWHTFSAEIGDDFTLALSDVTLTPDPQAFYLMNVVTPSGWTVAGASCFGWLPGCRLAIRNLPERGVYRVQLESFGASLSATLTISPALTGTLAVDAPLPLNLQLPAQAAQLRFTATAGQYLSLEIDALSTMPANTVVGVTVYNSADGVLTSGTAVTGTTLHLPNLAADTYFVWLMPEYPSTGTLQVVLRSTPTLTVDGPATPFTTTSFGQKRYWTINATAGDDFNLAVTGVTLDPTPTGDYYLYLLHPTGYVLTGVYCSGWEPAGCQLPVQDLLESGTYGVLVEPAPNLTISGTLNASVIP
jgi:YD repeat-containing protein